MRYGIASKTVEELFTMSNGNRDAFKRVVLKGLTFQWPRVDSCYRFNTNEQRSEKCQSSAAGASWSIGWSMSREDGDKLIADAKAHYEATADKNMPEFGKVFGAKLMDDGTMSFRAKKNGSTRNGDMNEPPTLVNGAKQKLTGEETSFWTDSKGSVRITMFAAKSPSGDGGVSFLLDAVQVTEFNFGGEGMDDFDDHPVAASRPLSERASAVQPVPPVKQAAAIKEIMEDEIPF